MAASIWSPNLASNFSAFIAYQFVGASGQDSFSVAPNIPSVSGVEFLVNGLEYPPSVLGVSGTSVTFPALTGGEECVLKLYVATPVPQSSAADLLVPAPSVTGVSTTILAELARGTISVHRFAGVVGAAETNDDTEGVQNAIEFAQENDLWLEFDGTKNYYFTAPLTWQHGRNATDTITYNIKVRGNGCKFSFDYDGDHVVFNPRCLAADRGSGREIAKINFSGIHFNGFFVTDNVHTSARALKIGKQSYALESFFVGNIEDVLITEYLNPPVRIEQSRMLEFNRVICRDMSGGIEVLCQEDGFTGDITFNNLQVQGTETKRPLRIYAAAASTYAECRGIRFNDAVFYGSGVLLEVGANGKIDDIWLTDCAWDGPDAPAGESPLELYLHDGGTMSQHYISSPYITNYTGSAIIIRRTGASSARALQFTGGTLALITATDIIDLQAADHVTFTAVNFLNNTGTNEIAIKDGCNHISINGCDSTSGGTNFVNTTGASTNNIKIHGNSYTNAGGIVNTSAAATYSATNNLAMTS